MKKCVTLVIYFGLFVPSFLGAQHNWTVPPATAQLPELVGQGFISTAMSERDFAISPDGMELFFTIQMPVGSFQTIMYSQKRKGIWSEPVVAPFAGHFSDLEPAFSSDGQTLFFASNRPLSGDKPKDFDIWRVDRTPSGWGTPLNLGTPINSTGDEFYPSITASGNLYYTATYAHGVGREDIFLARLLNGQYQLPIPLDTAINSAAFEFNAFVAPDESYIIFSSYGRKDDLGRGDLYISRKDASGHWLRAVNLQFLNSDRLDYCPFVSPDGKVLFFTSERHQLPQAYPGKPVTRAQLSRQLQNPGNGGGDIYQVSFQAIWDYLALKK